MLTYHDIVVYHSDLIISNYIEQTPIAKCFQAFVHSVRDNHLFIAVRLPVGIIPDGFQIIIIQKIIINNNLADNLVFAILHHYLNDKFIYSV